jgi:serine/threonine-protein kinase RsbW
MASSDQIQFHLSIDSRFENIELVQVVLNDTLERLGLGDDSRHWVDLATREAVANAIKHGNRGEPGRRVEIRMAVDGEDLVVSVADQGDGFNPGEVVNPLAPENLLRPNGRGLFYMQSFMDRVEFDARQGGGTVVTLRKRVFDPADTRTASREAARESDSGGDG